MAVIYHQTAIGFARIQEDGEFITSVTVHNQPGEDGTDYSVLTDLTAVQLNEYFSGKRKIFDLPCRQAGSAFQQKVWQQLQNIPYAETISYSQLSTRMSNPLAIRAIAAANGKNNLWVIVPCHRVIGADGSLTGYAGGLWRKKWLLELETKVAGVGQGRLFT